MSSTPAQQPAVRHLQLTTFTLALILFLSGFCSLIYQTVWLREFRLVFGGAAPAAAAVVAVFMAGLGFGGKFFGSWVERVARPFRFYARLEVGIAVAAVLSPSLLVVARSLYLKTGGTAGMGLGAATCLQLLMTALVLGLPCFLMGGTLPAAMKFAQREDDPRRSITAFFYGINIAGAVTGAALSTFHLLPTYGNKGALTIAVLANLGIALAAGAISMFQEKHPRVVSGAGTVDVEPQVVAKAPAAFVLAAAFMSGFTFFLAELVWYRVSTPLLGGSVYGFGLVLCVVLAGMGLGGLLYALMLKKAEPSLGGFTLVSALQALAVLLPYALGDRIAHLALILNDGLRGVGLYEMAFGWAGVMSLLAFLPSLLSGIQFPLLVSLLGRGNVGVGQQLGRAYLWNTFGSITGSLLGGFLLVPLLQLKGCWVLAASLIALMSAASLLLQGRRSTAVSQEDSSGLWGGNGRVAMALLLLSGFCVLGTSGPTAAWLQTGIGYGRVKEDYRSALGLESWKRNARRTLVQAYDGRETSVSVVGGSQYAFLTNGKSDGSAVGDAGTQVMLGITGAILHPHPQHACVVGLGTGTTAGWLADVPGMQRVDVLELEEEIRKVAQFFEPVSRGAMKHPRVNNITGDAREFLLTRGDNYDLIVSEPSNPCRAGVANLYTREFYENASQRLTDDGIFCQWLQGYEVDPATISTVIATLRQVFPKVEVWSTQSVDLLLICSKEKKPWSLANIRQRIQLEPMAEALRRFWQTNTAEGFLNACLANDDYTRALAADTRSVNTDDMNRLEFSFARSVAREGNCAYDLARAATKAGCHIPALDAPVDSALFLAERLHMPGRMWKSATDKILPADTPAEVRSYVTALKAYWKQDYATYLAAPQPATQVLADRIRQAYAKAHVGAPDALEAAAVVEPVSAADAHFLRAIACHEMKKSSDMLLHLERGLDALMQSPWSQALLVSEALTVLSKSKGADKTLAAEPRFMTIFDKLARSYPVDFSAYTRLAVRCDMSLLLSPEHQRAAVDSLPRPFPWTGRALAMRVSAYLLTHDPRLDEALEEMNLYQDQGGIIGGEAEPFVVAVKPAEPAPEPPTREAKVQGMTLGAQASR